MFSAYPSIFSFPQYVVNSLLLSIDQFKRVMNRMARPKAPSVITAGGNLTTLHIGYWLLVIEKILLFYITMERTVLVVD